MVREEFSIIMSFMRCQLLSPVARIPQILMDLVTRRTICTRKGRKLLFRFFCPVPNMSNWERRRDLSQWLHCNRVPASLASF